MLINHDEWISRPAAARVLGVNGTALAKMIQDGLLTTRTLPNCIPRVRLADVQALAERYTQAACEK